MARQNALCGILFALSAALLAGCLPAETASPGQHVVEWPEQRILFVADERSCGVQSFHLNAGAPEALAQTRRNQHSRVRDIQLDVQLAKLWVLGYNGISVFDARSLTLQRFIPLDGVNISRMRIENDHVVLLAGSGSTVGEIDSRGGVLGQIAAGFAVDVL